MLHQNRIFVFIKIIICLSACGPGKDEVNTNKKIDYIKLSKEYQRFSKGIVGDQMYSKVYKGAKDSLVLWAENNLKSYMQNKYDEWELDSLICFNKKEDKCIMAILYRSTYFNYATQDDVRYFNGVKIDNKWYFFDGSTVVVSREKGKPFDFKRLHDEAMKNVFIGYLKKSQTGEWEVNEKFFDRMINKNNPQAEGHKGGYGSCFHCKTFEEYVLYLTNENWKNRDTTQYSGTQ